MAAVVRVATAMCDAVFDCWDKLIESLAAHALLDMSSSKVQ